MILLLYFDFLVSQSEKLAGMEKSGVKIQLRQNSPFPAKIPKSRNYSVNPWTQHTVLQYTLPTGILTEMLLLSDTPNLPSQPIFTF